MSIAGRFLDFLGVNEEIDKQIDRLQGKALVTIPDIFYSSLLSIVNPEELKKRLQISNNTQLVSEKAIVEAIQGALQPFQTGVNTRFDLVQTGLQSLQTSVGVLQATTALIGVGAVAGAALSGVNLYQTLKLRKEVQQLRLEIKDGFLDLKQALKAQGAEIILQIDKVAQDSKFERHREQLTHAYHQFLEATKRMETAMYIKDLDIRKNELNHIRDILGNALAIYNNPELLSEISLAGKLRRFECAWGIEQAIVITYQLQNELSAMQKRLSQLKDKICKNSLEVIKSCGNQDEIDFLFPELIRIYTHDLPLLEAWITVTQIATSSDTDQLISNKGTYSTSLLTPINTTTIENLDTFEQYKNFKQKSHFRSLRDQLRLMMQSELRQEYITYISQQAEKAGYKTLVPIKLEKASNLTVANLYWYFCDRTAIY